MHMHKLMSIYNIYNYFIYNYFTCMSCLQLFFHDKITFMMVIMYVNSDKCLLVSLIGDKLKLFRKYFFRCLSAKLLSRMLT